MIGRNGRHQFQNRGTVGNYAARIYRIADKRLGFEVNESVFHGHFSEKAKSQLNLAHDQDDNYLNGLARSAILYFERVTSHYLRKQQRKTTFDGIKRQVEVPAVPWQSLDAVEFNDEGDIEQLSTDKFFVEEGTLNVVTAKSAATLPNADTMKVQYTVGYDEPEDVPDGPAHAIKMIIADLYEHRTSTPITGQTLEEAPFNADRLIAPFKVHTL
jgi:uncharacterized phiE125 gp8 family phage protein